MMTAASKENEAVYRAAVALNNMGVALLERSYFIQAFETLQDAARLMRQACSDDSSPSASLQPGEMIHLASKRLAGRSHLSSRRGQQQQHLVNVISDDLLDVSNTELGLLLENTTRPSHFVIRIERFSHGCAANSSVQTDGVLVGQSAIVLHNFGVCGMFLQRSGSIAGTLNTDDLSKIHSRSLKLFQLCQALHCKALESVQKEDRSQLYFLGYIYLRTLVQVLAASTTGKDLIFYQQRLERLRSLVERTGEVEKLMHPSDRQTAAAA